MLPWKITVSESPKRICPIFGNGFIRLMQQEAAAVPDWDCRWLRGSYTHTAGRSELKAVKAREAGFPLNFQKQRRKAVLSENEMCNFSLDKDVLLLYSFFKCKWAKAFICEGVSAL